MRRTVNSHGLLLSASIVLTFTLSGGCAKRTSVCVDTDFLRESPARMDYMYMDEHYPELLYLCLIGNRDAIAAGVSLMGHEHGIFAIDQDCSELARAIYETDFELFWEAFSHLDAAAQARVVAGPAALCPLDWCGEDGERERHVASVVPSP